MVRSSESFFQWDLTALLSSISTPTIVLHARNDRAAPIEGGQEIAAGIPGARFVSFDGHHVPDRKQMAQMDDAIREFVLGSPPRLDQTAVSAPTLPSAMTAILFADIADSTALTERLGDAAFRDKARILDGTLRKVIRDHAGTPIEGKLLGDGVLAVFSSARQAIEAATACGRAGNEAGLPLHLGLHAGDVIREDNNVYGGAVNIASRISGLSAPGEVLVSDTVRSLARTSAGVSFEDRGEQSLKGVGDPVRVFAASPP